GPHPNRQQPRSEAAEDARAEIETERRQLLALSVAAEEISDRRLPLTSAPAVERIERNQRHEHLTAGDLEHLHIRARRDDLCAQSHPLKRRDRIDALALADRAGEEGVDVLIL